jgi:hypothetical protein
MNSIPVISGRLAGYLEDFAKPPSERRTAEHSTLSAIPAGNSNASPDRETSRDPATVRGGALAQTGEQAAAPAPTAALCGHLVNRLV